MGLLNFYDLFHLPSTIILAFWFFPSIISGYLLLVLPFITSSRVGNFNLGGPRFWFINYPLGRVLVRK